MAQVGAPAIAWELAKLGAVVAPRRGRGALPRAQPDRRHPRQAGIEIVEDRADARVIDALRAL
jgi:hypothetical protein